MPMSCLWQAWMCADGSKKGNSLGLVLILEVVRSSRPPEWGSSSPDIGHLPGDGVRVWDLGASLGLGRGASLGSGTWVHHWAGQGCGELEISPSATEVEADRLGGLTWGHGLWLGLWSTKEDWAGTARPPGFLTFLGSSLIDHS